MTGKNSSWGRRNFIPSFRRSTDWVRISSPRRTFTRGGSSRLKMTPEESSTRTPLDMPSMSISKTIQNHISQVKNPNSKILRKKKLNPFYKPMDSMLTLSLLNRLLPRCKSQNSHLLELCDPLFQMGTLSSSLHLQLKLAWYKNRQTLTKLKKSSTPKTVRPRARWSWRTRLSILLIRIIPPRMASVKVIKGRKLTFGLLWRRLCLFLMTIMRIRKKYIIWFEIKWRNCKHENINVLQKCFTINLWLNQNLIGFL